MEKNGTRGSSTSQGKSRSKSSSKDNSRSTVLNFFILKFNVFWVLLLGRSNCIFLGDFVQELPKGGDCQTAKLETVRCLAIARMSQEAPRTGSRYSQTQARYSEQGTVAQFHPNSFLELEDEGYSGWIMIRSLMHELEAIYWVFLSTLTHHSLI